MSLQKLAEHYVKEKECDQRSRKKITIQVEINFEKTLHARRVIWECVVARRSIHERNGPSIDNENDDHELKYGLGANDDAVLKLAMMEQALVEMFKSDGTKSVEFNDTNLAVKSRIINALKGEQNPTDIC